MDLKLTLLVVLDLGKGAKKTLYISVECRKILALPADQAYCKYGINRWTISEFLIAMLYYKMKFMHIFLTLSIKVP